MTLPTEFRMSGDIIKIGVTATSAQKVGSRDEHAGGSYPAADIRDKDCNTFACECLGPDASCTIDRLRRGTYLRHPKEIEQRF